MLSRFVYVRNLVSSLYLIDSSYPKMGKKRRHQEVVEESEEEDSQKKDEPVIADKKFNEFDVKNVGQRLIVVLERANLESVKVNLTFLFLD